MFCVAELRSHRRVPLRLPLPPSHCNATTADRTVTSHCLFNTPHAVAGSTTAALFDYPPPQRERLLDLLFSPRLGAAVQVLKVEIPGDGDSTVSSEPSHSHSEGELSYERGVEYKMMYSARLRNPGVKLYALQWTAPAWVSADGHSIFSGGKNINYTLRWPGMFLKNKGEGLVFF